MARQWSSRKGARHTALMGGMAVALLALSACSSGGGTGETGQSPEEPDGGAATNGDQSVAQACDAIDAGTANLSTSLSTVSRDNPDDPDAVIEAARTQLQELKDSITNKEVKDVWTPVSDAQLASIEATAHDDQEKLQASAQELIERYNAFWEICPPDTPQS